MLLSLYAPQFLNNPSQTFIAWSLDDWIKEFLGYRIDGILGPPALAGQFWFVRDLIILVVISPLLRTLVQKFGTGFLIIVSILYFTQTKIYILETHALFFYVIGLYWGDKLPLLENVDKITWLESIIVFLGTFFSTYLLYGKESMLYGCLMIASCTLLLKFSTLIITHEKAFNIAAYFSVFSFFLYAIHMPVLTVSLLKIWLKFFPMKNAFFCLFEYFGLSILTIVIGTGIGIGLRKVCPPAFALFNGGRK